MTVTMDQAAAGQVDVTSTGTPVYSARTTGLHSLVNDFGLWTAAGKGFIFNESGAQLFAMKPNSGKALLAFGPSTDAQVWREASGKIKTNALVEIVPPAATGAITGLYSYMTTPGLSDATAGHFAVGQPYGAGNWSYGLKAFAPFTHYAPGLEVDDHRWLGLWGKGGAFLEDGSLGLTQSLIWPVFDDYQYALNDNPASKQYYNFHPQILSYNGVDGATVFSTGHGFLFDAYDMGTGADFGTSDAAIDGKMGKFHFTTKTTATGGVEKGLISLAYESGKPGIYIGDYTVGATPDLSLMPDVRLFREDANILATDDLFKAYQLQATAATGTAPLVVASTTVVTNLNADLLDGKSEAAFFTLAENETVGGNTTFNGGATFNSRPAFNGGTTGSTAPFTVDSTYKVSSLNADLLDGLDSTAFMAAGDLSAYFKLDEDETITGRPAFAGAISSMTPPFTVTGTYASVKVPNLHADLLDSYSAGNASGNIPVSNGTVNTNLNADLLDGYTAADFALASGTFISPTVKNQTVIGSFSSAYNTATAGKFIVNNNSTDAYYFPAEVQLYGTGLGTGSTDGLLLSSGYYVGPSYVAAKIWNYEASNLILGAKNKQILSLSDDTITVGAGTAGVDYQIFFDGESSDGALFYDEDEGRFRFDRSLRAPLITSNDAIYAFDSTAGFRGSATQFQVGQTKSYTRYDDTVIYTRAGESWSTSQSASNFSTYTDNQLSLGTSTRRWKDFYSYNANLNGYVDIVGIAAPGNPAAGTVRLYVDSTSGDLMAKNSAGTAVVVADF